MAMLFGRRDLLQLVAPLSEESAQRSAVVVIAPELRAPLSELLRSCTPAELLSPTGLGAVDAVVRETFNEHTAPSIVHQYLRYTFAGAFRPYVGPWLEWIEPLDDDREMEPVALGLLARFDRGVYVIRQSGHIVSYAGLRQQSPHVWDLFAHTQAHDLRGHGLGRAVVSRATRAALGEARLPLAAHLAGDQAATHIGRALGYRIYGETLVYSMRT
jgi:hypothetical protein